MAVITAEPQAKTEREPQEKKTTPTSTGPARGSRGPRKGRDSEERLGMRFFLAKPGSNGTSPAFEREVATENEALVESFKLGVPYLKNYLTLFPSKNG
jgi:hypothetical protein